MKKAYDLAMDNGLSPASLTGGGAPPQSFCRAGTLARTGDGARELKAIVSCADVFAKAVPRTQSLPYTHTINVTFPGADQAVRGPAPAGMHAQVYDCTPVELQAAAAGGSRVQQRLAEINNRSTVMNAINVACAFYRDSDEGDPTTGTPPFARILDGKSPPITCMERGHCVLLAHAIALRAGCSMHALAGCC